jgi:vacuolar-type H+-ATPase subunit I/STV1
MTGGSVRHVLNKRERAAVAVVSASALMAPWGVVVYSIVGSGIDHTYVVRVSILALLWAIVPFGVGDPQLLILDPLWMLMSALFGVFNILFAIWFARYYRQTASTRSTVFLGSLTLLVPSILAAVAWVGLPPDVAPGVYMGPVPVQLALGLLLMYLVKRDRMSEPWGDSLASSEWWEKDQNLRRQSESAAR